LLYVVYIAFFLGFLILQLIGDDANLGTNALNYRFFDISCCIL